MHRGLHFDLGCSEAPRSINILSFSPFLTVLLLMTSTCQAQNQDSNHLSSVFYGANRIKLGIWDSAMQEREAAEAQARAGRATSQHSFRGLSV